jgi:hypothetical protein
LRALARFGLPSSDLPDPVDSEQVAAWAVPYRVNMGELVSRMGGSP